MLTERGAGLIFLLSMPRSGSTLLSLMLASHPLICAPPEPWLQLSLMDFAAAPETQVPSFGDESATLATAYFLERLRGARNEFNYPVANTVSELLRSPPSPERAKLAALALYNAKLSNARKSFFVDKTPRYYLIADKLALQYPEAKFIFLKRDPLAVADSYLRSWNIDLAAEISDGRASPAVVDFGVGLRRMVQFASDNDRVHTTSYEDLIQFPERELRSICKFLALDFDLRMQRYSEDETLLQEFLSAPVGDTDAPRVSGVQLRKRSGLDTSRAIVIEKFLGPHLIWRLGYGAKPADWVQEQDTSPHVASEELLERLPRRNTALVGLDRASLLLHAAGATLQEIETTLGNFLSNRGFLTPASLTNLLTLYAATASERRHSIEYWARRSDAALAATRSLLRDSTNWAKTAEGELAAARVQVGDYKAWALRSDAMLSEAKRLLAETRAWAIRSEDTLEKTEETLADVERWARGNEGALLQKARLLADVEAWARRSDAALEEASKTLEGVRAWAARSEALLAQRSHLLEETEAWARRSDAALAQADARYSRLAAEHARIQAELDRTLWHRLRRWTRVVVGRD